MFIRIEYTQLKINVYTRCRNAMCADIQYILYNQLAHIHTQRIFNLISSIDWLIDDIALAKSPIKYLYDINYEHEYAQFAFSLAWLSTSILSMRVSSHPYVMYTHQMNGHLIGTVFAAYDKHKTVQLHCSTRDIFLVFPQNCKMLDPQLVQLSKTHLSKLLLQLVLKLNFTPPAVDHQKWWKIQFSKNHISCTNFYMLSPAKM